MRTGVEERSILVVKPPLAECRSHAAPLCHSTGFSKRALDLVLGTLALVLCLPVLILCALLIRLSSRGPVFYSQERMGRHGKPFTLFKLRTMHDNAEARSGAVWASDRDPRVVRTCRWMRCSHLDELPQLFNVLRGEMSLVGPRPERAEILEDLKSLYPHVDERLAVKPGITGLSQIRWSYDTTKERFRHKLETDLEYIRTRSMLMDVRILLLTIPKFLDRPEANGNGSRA